jgi:hypothetical protein
MFSGDRIERRGAVTVVYCSLRGWHLTRLAANLRTTLQQRNVTHTREKILRYCVSYIDVNSQSHASNTGVTGHHENDPGPVRQTQRHSKQPPSDITPQGEVHVPCIVMFL